MNVDTTIGEGTVEQTEWVDFILIPDDCFIFKTLEIEKKVNSKKIFSTIFGLLSTASPFPLDQLMWGYLPLNTQKTRWVYYMGLQERLQCFIGNPPFEKHLLPCSALGMLIAKPDEVCTLTCDGITSILVQKKPASCLKNESNLTSSSFKNPASSLPQRHLLLKSIQKTRHHHYRCCLSEQTNDTSARTLTVLLPKKLVWQADIRDKAQIQHLKKEEHTGQILQKCTRWIYFCLGMVFLFQLSLWIGQLVLHHKNSTYQSFVPIAQKVKNKDQLVQNVRTALEQEIGSFELLGLINTYRPSEIYFTQATIEQPNQLVIEAMAENTNLIQSYVKELQNTHYFTTIRADHFQTLEKGTQFQLIGELKTQKQSSFIPISRP